MRRIELLSPARNLECGIEAIRHGADAVYIGAPRFGARAAAGNSVDDIARLVDYAHPFDVRIYVTLNTLLRDDELAQAQQLMDELAQVHVDAFIVQDPRIHLPFSQAVSDHQTEHGTWLESHCPLHASTQMDNRTAEQVRRLRDQGYRQAVLARELSLEQIRSIHEAVPDMPLEVFVHGALCVSYSGRCQASEFCFGRSANRGECAQFCRLPFDLVDADGHELEHQRHLLSLRDMNRADDLEALLDAGVSSLKIEGRLKEVAYVKNITAYYRRRLDDIMTRRGDDYCRASAGQSNVSFDPQPQKSFNRGFTDYFLRGRTRDLACPETPKSMGEPVGTVKSVSRDSISVAGTATFAAGDGLCYLDAERHLQGFRVNSIDAQGRLHIDAPQTVVNHPMPICGTPLFRNLDQAFSRQLARPTAERRIRARWTLTDETADTEGFTLTLTDEEGVQATAIFDHPHTEARTPQSDNVRRQLSRMGDTIFTADDIDLQWTHDWFIPASTLADWRRQVVAALTERRTELHRRHIEDEYRAGLQQAATWTEGPTPPHDDLRQGILMTCRHCIRHMLGACTREKSGNRLHGPLSLRLSDGRTFPLHFDCEHCEMQVKVPH